MSSNSTVVTIGAPYVPLTIGKDADPTSLEYIRANNSAFAKEFQTRDFFQLFLFNQEKLPVIYRLENPADFPFQDAACKELQRLTAAARAHEIVIRDAPWTPPCVSESCWSNTKIGVLLVIGLGCAVFLSYPFGDNTPLNAIAAITVVRTAIYVLKHLKDVRDLRNAQKIRDAEKALKETNKLYKLLMTEQVKLVKLQANFCMEAWMRATPHERYEPALKGKFIEKSAQKELILSAMQEWRTRSLQLQTCIHPLVRKEIDTKRLLKPLEDVRWAIIFSQNQDGLDSVRRNMRIVVDNSILTQTIFFREVRDERLDQLLRDHKGGPRQRKERKQRDLEEHYGASSAATGTTTTVAQQQQKPPSPPSTRMAPVSVSGIDLSVLKTVSLATATAAVHVGQGTSLTLDTGRRGSTVQQQQQQQPQMVQAHSQPQPETGRQVRPATATRKSESSPAASAAATQPEVGTLPNQPRATTPPRGRSPAKRSHTKQASPPRHQSASQTNATAAATPPVVVGARREFGKAAQPKVPAKRQA